MLESLASAQSFPDPTCTSDARIQVTSTPAGSLTQLSNVQYVHTQEDNTHQDSDWVFDFLSPSVLEMAPDPIPTAVVPYTTTVCGKLNFPGLPTASQCEMLARQVFAAYARRQNTGQISFDPYRNNLNIATLSFAAGFFANALHLGLIEREYCHATAQSIFYRPSIVTSPYAETMTLAVQRSFDGLKHDLRPTPTQITTSHHPAMDILPFPNLRKRLIEGVYRDPPLLNEQEFWEDLKADGIVCWGNASMELNGGGVPWDARSWEAKQWFLDKYHGILGDDEDELWRGSQWWQEMRGDHL